jgi:hypothetical protein
MTLANLCVAYIMISDNEKAEEVGQAGCCAPVSRDLCA